ncbi:hypothetical protein Tco_0704124 [Tanacetum coccineum]|uniref:Uncharacterized protein n=1 Tax=Tanacetum coccineum TaxID=301880 RepID=A0ABQ4Y2S4_9ASTR
MQFLCGEITRRGNTTKRPILKRSSISRSLVPYIRTHRQFLKTTHGYLIHVSQTSLTTIQASTTTSTATTAITQQKTLSPPSHQSQQGIIKFDQHSAIESRQEEYIDKQEIERKIEENGEKSLLPNQFRYAMRAHLRATSRISSTSA